MKQVGGPSIDDCNDLIDWIEDNNDIDLKCVRLRIREIDVAGPLFVITCEWQFRSKSNPPKAHELMLMSGWVIDRWNWDGAVWTTSIWLNKKMEQPNEDDSNE